MKSDLFSRYREELIKAIEDSKTRLAIARAVQAYTEAKAKSLARLPHIKEVAERVREVKEECISKMLELAKWAKDSIEDNGGWAYIARTAEEARRLAGELVGSGRLVVKSKSMTASEIMLREYLEKLGNKVMETDLGDFIVQAKNVKPAHIFVPAVHILREDIAELFSKLLGEAVSPETSKLVEAARRYLRDYFFKADVGISGANVVAANTGTVFIIENEGNARFSSNAPPKHICITGIEKVVPTLNHAIDVVQVLPPYAAGNVMGSYVSMISAPSRTVDIESTLTYGVHGPKEFHVIFLDNGRTEMAKHPVLREALLCLRCGGCLHECPIYRVINGAFGTNYFAGIGAVWTAYTRSPEEAAPFTYACTTCGRCREHCPLEIDVPKLIEALRQELLRKKLNHPRHLELAESIQRHGNPYEEEAQLRTRWSA